MAWRHGPVKAGCAASRIAPIRAPMAKDKEREERLAAALRDNLRRRKAQPREADKPEPGEKAQP